MAYKKIANKCIKNYNLKNHKVIEAKYIEKDGVKYYVDGKNVVLDYSKKELEVANWLVNTFGGKIYMLPRVNYPKNIKTADYLWNDEFWDLKEIKGNSQKILDNTIKRNKSQSKNFIIDITNSKLYFYEIIYQINIIYNSVHRKWVSKIIIIKDNKLLMVIKRD